MSGERNKCKICKKEGTFRSLRVPDYKHANFWLCRECEEKYEEDLLEFNNKYFNYIEKEEVRDGG